MERSSGRIGRERVALGGKATPGPVKDTPERGEEWHLPRNPAGSPSLPGAKIDDELLADGS